MDFATLKSRLYSLIGRYPADICYELVTADGYDGHQPGARDLGHTQDLRHC